MPYFTFVAGSVTSCWTVVFRRSKINCIYTLPLSIVFCDNISCVRLFSKMYGRRRKKNQVKHPKLESSITSGSTVRLSAPQSFSSLLPSKMMNIGKRFALSVVADVQYHNPTYSCFDVEESHQTTDSTRPVISKKKKKRRTSTRSWK